MICMQAAEFDRAGDSHDSVPTENILSPKGCLRDGLGCLSIISHSRDVVSANRSGPVVAT